MAVPRSGGLRQKCGKILNISAAFSFNLSVVISLVRSRIDEKTLSHRKSLLDSVILSHRSVLTFEYLHRESKIRRMSSLHTCSLVIMSAEALYEFGLCDGYAMDDVSQKSLILRGSALIEARPRIRRQRGTNQISLRKANQRFSVS